MPADWCPVLERHPDGESALPGYVWVESGGRALHVQADHLEFRED
ncbi:MAG: hypothetical protein ACREMO_05940 [Gemmatimonadales bacterium]